MKNIATVHILGFLSEWDALLEIYRKEVLQTLITIKPDVVVVCGKRRGDVASPTEAKNMTAYLQKYYSEPSYYTQPQTITVVETLELNKKLFAALGEIDHVHVVSSNIQFYLYLLLCLRAYGPLLGYVKSEEDMNQTIIDLFKSKSKSDLGNIGNVCLGKFCFYPIEEQRGDENYIYYLASTVRELMCVKNEHLHADYVSRRKDQRC